MGNQLSGSSDQMARELVLRQIRHLVERARFLEQVRGAGHALEARSRCSLANACSFNTSTPTVVPARYQQRRRPDPHILARAPARRPWSTEEGADRGRELGAGC
jgi:hypothetical protein